MAVAERAVRIALQIAPPLTGRKYQADPSVAAFALSLGQGRWRCSAATVVRRKTNLLVRRNGLEHW